MWDVIVGWMVGFECVDGGVGIGNDCVVMFDYDMCGCCLCDCWVWECLDVFLVGCGRIGFWFYYWGDFGWVMWRL